MNESDRSSDGFDLHNPFDPFDAKPVFLPVASDQADKAFKAMTDHLLWQQRARFLAKKGVKPWQAGRVTKRGYSL